MSTQKLSKVETMRHSTAHLMAAAILELYPEAKFGVGPIVENGFYYDIDLPTQLGPTDLQKIEKRMKKIRERNEKFVRKEITIKEAIDFFNDKKQDYKVELLRDLQTKGTTKVDTDESFDIDPKAKEIASIYETGKFVDLCRGPHVEKTRDIGAFKLTKLAGAYWRGNEENKMLQRVYGVAFETEKEVTDYLHMQEEAAKRDHRKLGKELGLFIFSELVGPGLPLYTWKGVIVRKEIMDYCRELQEKIGYKEVHTPNINKAELFKISGHYEKYKEDMLKVSSNYAREEYYLKPMNCPQHTQIYASEKRSYRELPIRISDFANLYRDERPGELNGLSRLRCFSQDDGHAFVREDQIKDEFVSVLEAIKKALATYKMDYQIRLSLWDKAKPEKYLGEPSVWKKAQKILEEILIENKIKYITAIGEAAIYGPKMDIVIKDSLGREWQISTIQLDLIMPERFKLTYIDKDGTEKVPIMIHRAIIGSPERFMSVLIEHYAGAFPVWLAPVQIAIIPVSENHIKLSVKLMELLKSKGLRVECDEANESVGYKIRRAETQKIPYMLVIGDKEKPKGGKWGDNTKLAVRVRGKKDIVNITLKKFIEKIGEQIKNRKD